MKSIFDSLSTIEHSEDLESIKTEVRDVARAHGYDRIIMFSVATRKDELVENIYWAEGQWFDEGEFVDAETHVRHCPVTRHVLETDQPFFWTKSPANRGRRYRFFAAPQEPGLHGLQVPVFGNLGLLGAVCFGGEKIDGSPKVRMMLTQLGTTAFLKARSLLETPDPGVPTQLSEREMEVLQWIASGRRVSDIAGAFGISERTVESHLRRIRQRLQVKTTAQAISTALRSGSLQGASAS